MGWSGEHTDRELERRVVELLSAAQAAGARRDTAGMARLSGEATDICRELVERHPRDVRHLGALAAALYNHSYRLMQVGRAGEAHDVLAESHRHYTTLASLEPGRHAVALCDVRLRGALAFVMDGRYAEAERRASQVLAEYSRASAADELEREFGTLRARTLIGRALLLDGRAVQALPEFDAALFAGERLREERGLQGTDFGWLARAPESFRLAAPEWLGAAVAAMELHDAAGRWPVAADAANVAMRLAGGLAAIGDDSWDRRFTDIHDRARTIWASAAQPGRTAAQRAGPLDEVMVGGGQIVRGPRLQPDLARICRLAGWAQPTGRPS